MSKKPVKVRGYVKKDGTLVHSYTRNKPKSQIRKPNIVDVKGKQRSHTRITNRKDLILSDFMTKDEIVKENKFWLDSLEKKYGNNMVNSVVDYAYKYNKDELYTMLDNNSKNYDKRLIISHASIVRDVSIEKIKFNYEMKKLGID